MPKQVLRPTNLSFQPRPEYPYSPGTSGGRLVYTAGQVAWNERAELVGARRPEGADPPGAGSNVESVLREGGATLADVLKCNVYLADIRYFQAMNEVFAAFFREDPPARTTVQAAARRARDARRDRGDRVRRGVTAQDGSGSGVSRNSGIIASSQTARSSSPEPGARSGRWPGARRAGSFTSSRRGRPSRHRRAVRTARQRVRAG